MKKNKPNTLQELILNREKNLKFLITRSDDDLKDMINRYLDAKQTSWEKNRVESFNILEEKISQLREAQELKFSYSDEASDWIHW